MLLLGLLPWWGMAAGASADSLTLDRFLAGETNSDDFHISRPVDLGHLRVGVQVHGDYAYRPLVIEGAAGDDPRVDVVEHQVNNTLGLSFGLLDRLVLYASLPVVVFMDGEDSDDLEEAPDDPGLGNLVAGARLRVLGEAEDLAALALQTAVSMPTAGGDQLFRGDDRFAVHPELLVSVRPGPLRFVLNAGARIHSRINTGNAIRTQELTFGLGFGAILYRDGDYPDRHLDLLAQVWGATEVDPVFDQDRTPVEVLSGLKFFHESGFSMGAAGGLGLTEGVGGPDARAVAMLGWAMPAQPKRLDTDGDGWPNDEDDCIAQPEDIDGFLDTDGCPDPDDDGDGIEDHADRCRTEAEDMDGFEDTDGCPELDNDGDGLLDGGDQCPTEPEDLDGFQDFDGCPELDNDGDGIPDADDACAGTPGVAEHQGCRDPDRDDDGVLDRLDNCPDEAGDPDNHGCKDKQQVSITAGRLAIQDVVYFQSGNAVLQPRSFSLLMNVAQVINNHPEIPLILVEGHSDSRGDRGFNLKLSRDRAKAVREFLVRDGQVDPARLEAVGYGPDQPLVPNARTAAQHAQNRRVEFSFRPSKPAAPATGGAMPPAPSPDSRPPAPPAP